MCWGCLFTTSNMIGLGLPNLLLRISLVFSKFFGVEIYPLILASVTALSETFIDGFECILDAFAQPAFKDGWLGGAIEYKFTGLSADLHDLALFYDNHVLTVRKAAAEPLEMMSSLPFVLEERPLTRFSPLHISTPLGNASQ